MLHFPVAALGMAKRSPDNNTADALNDDKKLRTAAAAIDDLLADSSQAGAAASGDLAPRVSPAPVQQIQGSQSGKCNKYNLNQKTI